MVDYFRTFTCVGLLITFAIFSNSTPINRQVGISENVFITVQNDTYGVEQRVCSIDSLTYGDGESIPTSSPCENCICRPPGFACTIISCDYRPGCKAFKRSNQCCPEYQCECEKDGRIYQNGEKIMDSNNPCEICYCQGGEINCAVIDCYWRSDCQPRYIESRCCPLYDHCPSPSNPGQYMRPTIPTTTTASGFPWYNLSNALYEVPQKPTPTPLPIFVTSRSTETTTRTSETISSTTPVATDTISNTPSLPGSQPELIVVATERVPVEVNILETAQEQGEETLVELPNEIHSTPSSLSENIHSVVSQQEPSLTLEINKIENQTSHLSIPQIVPSMPTLSMLESTTIFAAPVIAISIIPSPVEHIMVTQEVQTPEVISQVIDNGNKENETVFTSNGGTVEITTEAGESHANEELISPTESLPPHAFAEESVTTTQGTIFVSETEAATTEKPEPSQSHTVAAEGQDMNDQKIVNLEASEIPSTISTVDIEVESEVTTQASTPNDGSFASNPSQLDNSSTSNKESIVPDVDEITVTPSNKVNDDDAEQEIQDGKPEVTTSYPQSHDEKSPEKETTTTSSNIEYVHDSTIQEVGDIASATFAPVIENSNQSAVYDEVSNFDNLPNIEVEGPTYSPPIAQQDSTDLQAEKEEELVSNLITTQVPIIQTEVQETILNDPTEPIIESVKSTTVFPDFADNETLTTITTHSVPVEENESFFDDVVHITAEKSSDLELAPHQDEQNLEHIAVITNPSINEVNIIDNNTFEIIPPQQNNEPTIPETQNQIMDETHKIDITKNREPQGSNEVDAPSDINSGDDTVEIFNGHIPNSDDSVQPEDENKIKTKVTTTMSVNVDPSESMQNDAVVILAATDYDTTTPAQIEVEEHEQIHTDDQHDSSDDSEIKTESPKQRVADEQTSTPRQISSNDDIKENEVKFSETTTLKSIQEEEEHNSGDFHQNDDSHIDHTTESPISVQNDEVEPEDFLTTTNGPDGLSSSEKAHKDQSNSKFRLDLSAFDESGEGAGSHEVQSTVTLGGVVFDEAQITTHPPQNADESVVRDDVSKATTISNEISRDDFDVTTTQKYRLDILSSQNEGVQPIQNFEFDEVPAPVTTISPIQSDEPETEISKVTTTYITNNPKVPQSNEAQNSLRNEESDQTTVKPLSLDKNEKAELYSDVEVTTTASSGFGAEFREEIINDSTTIGPAYKSDTEDLPTTVEPIALDDESQTVANTTPYPLRSDVVTVTSLTEEEAMLNDGDATTVSSDFNETSTVPIAMAKTHVVSIDEMMIPANGVAVPAFSDDIAKPKSDLSRSDIGPLGTLEGENDSWLVQTAIKNRQMQGLFPSSRSQKRLFKPRQPRDSSSFPSGSQYLKTPFTKT